MPGDDPLPEVHFPAFQPQDYPRLIAAIDGLQALVPWAGPLFRLPRDEGQLEAYRASALGEASIRRIHTACDVTGQPVGHVELNDIDGYAARLCRVLIDPPFRGRGAGRAMDRQALHTGFDEPGLQRIDLGVYGFNTTAVRCYELEIFVKEGHLRQARKVGDETWSLDPMGILESECRRLENARPEVNPGEAR